MSFFAEDPEEQDVYNQMAAHLDLDSFMRAMWRELFAVSQCYMAVTTRRQQFKVRGTTAGGNQRRKTFDLIAPDRLFILDPTKVIPIGSPYAHAYHGTEQLAYIATREEATAFSDVAAGGIADPLVAELIVRRYEPDRVEAAELSALGVEISNLFLLDPVKVYRHCLTVPAYRRLSDVRMKGIFELLDMKHQLRQMERVHLISGTNFIVLITKGTDQHPALPAEVANLQAQVRTAARVPILVGDHRLNVEIVTPKLDNTLRAERWNAIDARITARLYGMFMLGNYQAGASSDDSTGLIKVIARAMESRRHMMRRCLERHVFNPMFDGNEVLKTKPKLEFNPRSIALDFDAAYASFLFDLRQANEISRETILNQFDLDQRLEAVNRSREEEMYDDIFQTQVPFSTPNQPAAPGQTNRPNSQNPALPRDNGGGRRNGGGAAPGTGQGQEPRRRAKRAPASDHTTHAAATPRLTITVEGTDEFTRDDLVHALRAALNPGEPDDANGTSSP
jgi:hypothetical protein